MLRLIIANRHKNVFFTKGNAKSMIGSYAFSTNIEKQMDPPYMIDFDQPSIDPKTIQVPYLRDNVRIDMYAKYKSDPTVWTVEKLSQHYGSNIDRTNAVLYLMQKREEVQKKLGVLDMPPEYTTMYEKHMADPEVFTPVKLSEEFGINIEQVGEILQNLKIHHARLNTLQESEAHLSSVMAVFEEQGIDTSFREIPKSSRLEGRYHPRFFGDEQEEDAIKEMKRLIERDTRAKVEPALDDYLKYAEKSTLIAPEEPNNANVKTDTFSRWKFAFRDSSKIDTQPTMIRTRKGEWRVATPYEEANRSWSPSPSFINQEIHKHKFNAYLDYDKDEKAASQLSRKKRQEVEARKKAKEASAKA